MIVGLQGTLWAVHLPSSAHLMVQGVVYEILCGQHMLAQLPPVGTPVTVCTHAVVREDHQQLFAFLEHDDMVVFKALLRVAGVGPKLAQTAVDQAPGGMLADWIQQDDAAQLARIPGIGRRLAQRLITELKDKTHTWPSGAHTPAPVSRVHQDAVSGLMALGYTRAQAVHALGCVQGAQDDPSAWLRAALPYLTQQEHARG